MDASKVRYRVQKMTELTEDEFISCAELFSANYGYYREDSPFHPGQSIRMSGSFFERKYRHSNVYIASAIYRKKRVGQAIYIRKHYEDVGTMTWVLQLVVADGYRKYGIGSQLLHSIWGFSNDFAWGLATANPCTIKALESATFRRCDPLYIKDNLKYIKRLADEIHFVDTEEYIVDERNGSFVNTEFFVDNAEYVDAYKQIPDWKLGKLEPGYEWLAFTFREQHVDKQSFEKHFSKMLEFSDEGLKDAYSRMNMSSQGWTKGTSNEVDYIKSVVPKLQGTSKILDLGCGLGRHALAFATEGFSVKGVDFSSNHINYAKKKALSYHVRDNVKFVTKDIRSFSDNEQYDLVLSLYDVIGSYPGKEDNMKILQTIVSHMKNGGYCVISVMNMELTKSIVPGSNHIDVEKDIQKLYDLQPSSIMQMSGDIFNPEYILIDKDTDVIYRKEQFSEDRNLPAEYIVRDKRYMRNEIENMLESVGLTIITSRYVQAGHFDVELSATDNRAKEILIIAKK